MIESIEAAASTPLERFNPDGEAPGVCDEAGPYGYGVFRQIRSDEVVAPVPIPTRGADALEHDRRDLRNRVLRGVLRKATQGE